LIHRFAARIGSAAAALALAAAALAITAAPAHAQQRAAYLFDGKRIAFTHVQTEGGRVAIAVDDPGLRDVLDKLGATLTWQNEERYVLVTTAEPLVISFAIGDTRYDVGPVAQQAPFAPFLLNGVAYVPLVELLHGLNLDVKRDGSDLVLQPQLTSIDVQATAQGTRVIARAGTPLNPRVLSDANGKVVVAFDGVGTNLQRTRAFTGGGLRQIDLRTEGTAHSPRTVMTLTLAPGSGHSAPASDDARDFTMTFGTGVHAVVQAQPPEQQPAPDATANALASVSNVTSQMQGGAFVVNVDVDRASTFEWHRLRPPDNRFWLDVHNARMAIAPKDEPGAGGVQALRVHQVNPQTVRVALSLGDFNDLTVTPTETGITISVASQLAASDTPRAGSGSTGTNAVAYATPAPAPSDNGGWKFGAKPAATYVPTNPKLIVLDPGHGGSDAGAIRNGVSEKTLSLDMSKRLRDILVARGWQVVMTHTDDRDVYGPNASDHDELQARVDVGNAKGARMFVSVHVNSFINAGPRGTTTYFYKPSDSPLAQAIQRRLAPVVGTKDDGVQKDRLYVLNHTLMPSALVETAFISNPDDFARLTDPQWRQRVAKAIADGIADYAQTSPANTADGQ